MARQEAEDNEREANKQAKIARENEHQAKIAADIAKQKHEDGVEITVELVKGLYTQMQSKRLSAAHGPEMANCAAAWSMTFSGN